MDHKTVFVNQENCAGWNDFYYSIPEILRNGNQSPNGMGWLIEFPKKCLQTGFYSLCERLNFTNVYSL